MTKLFARVALTSAAAALLLAGCTTKEPGSASPVSTPSAPASSEGSTSANPGGATTSSLDPCSLLSASDLASYGTFGEPRTQQADGARSCGYILNTQNASDPQLSVSVDIRDSQGIDSAGKGKSPIPSQVNGRKAAVIPVGSQSCILAMAVGDTSRVDLSVGADDSTKACDVATKVANIVEPKLPKG